MSLQTSNITIQPALRIVAPSAIFILQFLIQVILNRINRPDSVERIPHWDLQDSEQEYPGTKNIHYRFRIE